MAERIQRSSSPTSKNQGTEGVLGFLGRDMAVDLGTANTLVYVRGTDLLMRPAGGGHLTQLFSSIHSPGSFAVTSGAVYAVTRRSPHEPWSLVATRPQDRRVAPIVTFEREVGDGISVSPDERHVLITQEVRQVLDVMTVDEVDLTRYAP